MISIKRLVTWLEKLFYISMLSIRRLGLEWPQYTTHEKMQIQNIIQHGTKTTGFDVVIDRCSLDNLHEGPNKRPANSGCSFFRYTNNELSNNSNQRYQRRKRIRENNKFAIDSYSRSHPIQREYRKMIETWEECSRFNATSQRLADQARTIKKIGFLTLKY